MSKLDEIRKRHALASPGGEAYEFYSAEQVGEIIGTDGEAEEPTGAWWVRGKPWLDIDDEGLYFIEPEAKFYAHAAADMKYLLDHISKLEARLDAVRRWRHDWATDLRYSVNPENEHAVRAIRALDRILADDPEAIAEARP